MKRFLLSSLLLLGMGRTAFAFLNNGTIQVPPMDPSLIQIDDVNFVNRGKFQVDLTLDQILGGQATILYQTHDTLNVTNSGVLIGVPGFDFGYFPASVGVPHMLANFVNTNSGLGSGIFITNIYQGQNEFLFSSPPTSIINYEVPGLATFKVRATNIVDSGLITMDNTGLIDLSGQEVNLNHAQLQMVNTSTFAVNTGFGITYLDWASGIFGDTNNFSWFPFFDLTPTNAVTPAFVTAAGDVEQMTLTNVNIYFENLNPGTNANGIIVWRGVYLQDSSPANVTNHVYFDSGAVGSGVFQIEWEGTYRDPLTGQPATNYLYLSDDPAIRRSTNTFNTFPGVPNDISFTESTNKLIFATPATAGYVNPAPPTQQTNDFSYVSVRPTAVLVDTNNVIGGSPTNLPGRIQIAASGALNLANVRLSGPNYMSLRAPNNFLGNSNSAIAAPYADLDLGVTNGSLTFSNLLIPSFPIWSGVPGAGSAVSSLFIGAPPVEMGGIQAWSGSYLFVDANGITNDVRMLLINSALQPTAPGLQQDVRLHAPNNLVISDVLNVFRNFFSDTKVLTIASNDNSAFSLQGGVNLLSQNIFWSSSLPNLQFFTNFGVVSALNQINFAGNMLSPLSDPSGATPYQAFVNHGSITADGLFVRANYFENSGSLVGSPDNLLDIAVNGPMIATNGSFISLNNAVSLAASSMFLSNGVITAGQNLSLAASCFISDGYVFGNQFGHITNAVFPNVVTNGNFWTVGGGVQVASPKPTTGDLLGTTITVDSLSGGTAVIGWPGEDRGAIPGGYATNLAVGQLILNGTNNSDFSFVASGGNNAIYIDRLELQGTATNIDNNGNPKFISIQPGMKVFYAEAIQNGVSIAEKLNGKFGGGTLANGGQFFWVSNYAGVFSSTNMAYPDGNTYIFNHALAVSPDIDSDGDLTVNRDDSTPISIGTVFDIINNGPQSCTTGDGGDDSGGGGGGSGGGGANINPQILLFPKDTTPTSSGAPFSPALAQGTYNGLFAKTNGVTPASSGFFTAKVTSKGGLSAKLQIGTQTYSFSKPPFDASGHLQATATSKGAASLTVDLQVVDNDEIVGEVSNGSWTAQLLAERSPFGGKNQAPWAGTATLLLVSATNSTASAGDSFGSVKISTSGDVQWTGVLPDGTKISQKTGLSKDGTWPLYAAPYNGAGSFIGWMSCTNHSEINGSGVWIVPAGKSKLYPQGLTNKLDAAGASISGLTPVSATAILSGPSLSSPITNVVTIVGKSGQSSDGTVKLSVNAKTGLFTGTVAQPGNQSLSFQGAFLEKSGIGGGFFLNAAQNQGGKIYLAPAN